jgi:hypothetical protein
VCVRVFFLLAVKCPPREKEMVKDVWENVGKGMDDYLVESRFGNVPRKTARWCW